jgi:metallo-beta-lactamase family protein
VIIVGYQAEETKGRLLLEGIKTLRIFHEEVEVKADIFSLDSLSAHADYMDILKWMREFKRKPACIFLNHGEKKGSSSLKKLLEAEFEVKCHIPRMYEDFSLSAWEYS